MSVIYNRVKSGGICLEDLHLEISNGIPTLLELILVNDNYFIELTFFSTLSPAELVSLDNIILNHTCTDFIDTGNDFEEFATTQITNSVSIDITPTTYDVLPLDTIHIQNKPSIIFNNNTDSTITVYENGLYNISFNGILEIDIGNVEIELFVLRNLVEIPINNTHNNISFSQPLPWQNYGYGNQYNTFNIDININFNLLANDNVYIKAKKIKLNDSLYGRFNTGFPASDIEVYTKLKVNSILSITKLAGIAGPPGEIGLPGKTDLIIKKQNAIKSRDINTLNFAGNVSVTDDGNNQSTITILSDTDNFLINQITGADGNISEPMAFLVDSTRNDKLLSIESTMVSFSENKIHDNDWLGIGEAHHGDTGTLMPYDGTIVRVNTISHKNSNYNLCVYINNNLVDTFVCNNSTNKYNFTNINIPFNKNDIIGFKINNITDDEELKSVIINMWSKWEVRI